MNGNLSEEDVKLRYITSAILNAAWKFENIRMEYFTDGQILVCVNVIAHTRIIGKIFIVENLSDDAVFASYLIRVKLAENIFPKYIKIFAGSPLYWRQIIDKSQRTVQSNVNGKSLSKLIIPLPTLDEQERIVKRLDELLALC